MVKGGAFLAVLVVGLAPILLIGLIVTETGLGLVALRPPILWTDQFGASSGDNSASLVSADSTGVYVQGYLSLSNVYGGFLTTGSLFLSKHDPAGEAVWMRNVGNTSYNIWGISLATDGVYLIGTFGAERGCIVWKYSLSGDWFGREDSEGYKIAIRARFLLQKIASTLPAIPLWLHSILKAMPSGPASSPVGLVREGPMPMLPEST